MKEVRSFVPGGQAPRASSRGTERHIQKRRWFTSWPRFFHVRDPGDSPVVLLCAKFRVAQQGEAGNLSQSEEHRIDLSRKPQLRSCPYAARLGGDIWMFGDRSQEPASS